MHTYGHIAKSGRIAVEVVILFATVLMMATFVYMSPDSFVLQTEDIPDEYLGANYALYKNLASTKRNPYLE